MEKSRWDKQEKKATEPSEPYRIVSFAAKSVATSSSYSTAFPQMVENRLRTIIMSRTGARWASSCL